MSKLTINLTGQTVQEESDNRGSFKPLPAGTYKATLYDVEAGEYGPNSANSGRPKYDLEIRITEGEFAKRVLWTHVPLFLEWAPKPGKEKGADAFMFYNFFGPIAGKTSKEFRAEVKEIVESGDGQLDIPTPEQLLGKEVLVTVNNKEDDWAYKEALESNPDAKPEDFRRNDVTGFALPEKGSQASTAGKFKL